MRVIPVNSVTDEDSCKVIDDEGFVLYEGSQRECDDYIMHRI